MNRRSLMLAALGGLIFAAAPRAGAHHSTAMFDMEKLLNLEGEVESFEWTNPHTFIWLNVKNAKGGVDRWGLEGMSPNYLGREGWTRKTLKPGDKIKVTYFPLRDGRKGGFCNTITLPDGKTLHNLPEPDDDH
jgi:hypothetical protein